MTKAVLDSSAVLALLLEEPGATVVRAHLDDASLSAVNLQEVVKVLGAMGFASPLTVEMLYNLKLDIRPHEEQDAFQAAQLAPLTRRHGRALATAPAWRWRSSSACRR